MSNYSLIFVFLLFLERNSWRRDGGIWEHTAALNLIAAKWSKLTFPETSLTFRRGIIPHHHYGRRTAKACKGDVNTKRQTWQYEDHLQHTGLLPLCKHVDGWLFGLLFTVWEFTKLDDCFTFKTQVGDLLKRWLTGWLNTSSRPQSALRRRTSQKLLLWFPRAVGKSSFIDWFLNKMCCA